MEREMFPLQPPPNSLTTPTHIVWVLHVGPTCMGPTQCERIVWELGGRGCEGIIAQMVMVLVNDL
jgi:hypothetical protein